MITLSIEEKNGYINFNLGGIDMMTKGEKAVILSILQSMNNDFTIEETEIILERKNDKRNK